MIFILGGNGFIGSAFVRYCSQQGLKHAVLSRENYHEWKGQACTLFINANGNSKKFLARESPLEEFDASVRSVRASLIDFRAERYVHLSTCDVYPDCASPATTGEDGALAVANQSPYGFHKYLAEQCVRHAARSWLIVRMGGFVGPGLKKNPIFDILQGGPLWLDPASALQFLGTDALARIVFQLLERGLDREVINICGAGLIELREVISQVGRPVDVKAGSPCVRYDVSIDKLSRLAAVPQTRETVRTFVREQLEAERNRNEKRENHDHFTNAFANQFSGGRN